MKKQIFLGFLLLIIALPAIGQVGAWDPELEEKCQEVIQIYKDTNSNLTAYFEEAYGYAVFPSIGKGAVGIGGAHGRGVVYEQEVVIGQSKMTQISVGFQWGGQVYSEIIFFEDEEALELFKTGDLEFAAQASAIVVTTGASVDVAYKDGVAVFTMPKKGLMYEASIGGQKFKFIPKKN